MPIHWIDPQDASVTWSSYGANVPEVFVVSGWATPAFNALGHQVRQSGGSVIVMIDNRWRGDLRQWIAPIVFRTKYPNWFQAAIVPGKAARRFARHLGIPDNAIYEGLYSGNPNVFVPGPPLAERPTRLLFVGRFEERKGIRELADAWQAVQPQLPGWELCAVGEGPLRGLLERIPGVVVHPFQQLMELAEFYSDSRFLVLPSHEDHWGVVVHEASRCGCGMLLSENVGAREDLANVVNSLCFPPRDAKALANAIVRATQLTDSQLRAAYHESLALAYRFGPRMLADAVAQAIDGLQKRASISRNQP